MSRNVTVRRLSDDVTLRRYDDSVTVVYDASTRQRQWAIFQQPGTLATGVGVQRFYIDEGFTVVRVRVGVSSAPTGTDLIVDVNKNGSTLFTTQGDRPTIAAGGFTDVAVPAVTALETGDYLTVDIDQVGSGAAGENLVVKIELIQ